MTFINSVAALARVSRTLDRWLSRLTLAFAWMALLLLIGVTVLSVVGRRFHRADWSALYELGATLFFALVMLSFGYAYLRDGHVRVDLFRDRLPARWIARQPNSLRQGERSSAVFDLPYQWVIKATVPLGFLLLLLSAVSVTIRNGLFLMGQAEAPAPGDDRRL